MSYMSQNFRLFHVSNLSVRNFRIFLLMYTGSLVTGRPAAAALAWPDAPLSPTLERMSQRPLGSAPCKPPRHATAAPLWPQLGQCHATLTGPLKWAQVRRTALSLSPSAPLGWAVQWRRLGAFHWQPPRRLPEAARPLHKEVGRSSGTEGTLAGPGGPDPPTAR